jgi:hypothetical protein
MQDGEDLANEIQHGTIDGHYRGRQWSLEVPTIFVNLNGEIIGRSTRENKDMFPRLVLKSESGASCSLNERFCRGSHLTDPVRDIADVHFQLIRPICDGRVSPPRGSELQNQLHPIWSLAWSRAMFTTKSKVPAYSLSEILSFKAAGGNCVCRRGLELIMRGFET